MIDTMIVIMREGNIYVTHRLADIVCDCVLLAFYWTSVLAIMRAASKTNVSMKARAKFVLSMLHKV